jgi:hypothetical protein
MPKIRSISKWNSKEADRYVSLKGGGVLWANRIGKKEDYSQKQHNIHCSRLNKQLKGGSNEKKYEEVRCIRDDGRNSDVYIGRHCDG